MSTRSGFNKHFLGLRTPFPNVAHIKGDIVKLGRKTLIPYTHFSVCLSKSRRLAHFVAWNVDGASRQPDLTCDDRIRFDSRLPSDRQIGASLYSHNPLDRGHIARRADVAWGPRAEHANNDSCHYTNLAPQHRDFNQSAAGGIWGELENHILNHAEAQDQRLSIFAGPIFTHDDPEYRGVRLPLEFWKLVTYRSARRSRRLAAAGFVLSQRRAIRHFLEKRESAAAAETSSGVGAAEMQSEIDLTDFKCYQQPVSHLSALTGLDFSEYNAVDVMDHVSMVLTELSSLEAIVL